MPGSLEEVNLKRAQLAIKGLCEKVATAEEFAEAMHEILSDYIKHTDNIPIGYDRIEEFREAAIGTFNNYQKTGISVIDDLIDILRELCNMKTIDVAFAESAVTVLQTTEGKHKADIQPFDPDKGFDAEGESRHVEQMLETEKPTKGKYTDLLKFREEQHKGGSPRGLAS